MNWKGKRTLANRAVRWQKGKSHFNTIHSLGNVIRRAQK
jgi:hypothetical protein